MNSSARPLVLFGGTFDPIHRAHVRAALAVSRLLGDARVRLLPNAVPPHRPQPRAAAGHRLAMVRHACAGHPALSADPWELSRPGPSYTLATLRHYRRRIGPARPLVFLIGADSLAGLAGWHRWREFTALCHLAVVPRPGAPSPAAAIQRAFPEAPPRLLMRRPAGRRLTLTRPRLDISSTEVRDQLAATGRCAALSPAVMAYIHHHGLYTKAANNPDNEAS